LSPTGRANFHIQTLAKWDVVDPDSEDTAFEDSRARTALETFKPDPQSQTELLLAVTKTLVLIDSEGNVLSSVALEHEVPISPVVFGDWNNDGYSDIIVETNKAYVGFALEHSRTGSVLFTGLVAALLVTMTSLFAYNFAEMLSPSNKRRFSKRSTD